jgi:hypothetical protein
MNKNDITFFNQAVTLTLHNYFQHHLLSWWSITSKNYFVGLERIYYFFTFENYPYYLKFF